MTALNIYVYYHDETLLDLVRPRSAGASEVFRYVDLNQIAIPSDLRLDGLNDDDTRTVYSEYLAAMTIRPTSDMVGSFTYSVPLKFSEKWARHAGMADKYLPPVRFDDMLKHQFREDLLFGVQFEDPCKFEANGKYVHEVHAVPDLRVGAAQINSYGPYKTSVIVSRERFGGMQHWLRRATRFLLDRHGWQLDGMLGEQSPFAADKLKVWNAGQEDTPSAKTLRHGISFAQEMLVAYYFGQTFADEAKIKLGELLVGSAK